MGRFSIHSPYRAWKKTDLPNNAHINLSLATFSKVGEEVLLSANLMTDSEIDYAIDDLKDQLEKLRKKAKAELKSQNEKIRSAVHARSTVE